MRKAAAVALISLLVLVCEIPGGRGTERGVLQCGPQNVSMTGSDQELLVTWEDGPSCASSRGPLTYELVVLVADKEVHYQVVPVTPDAIGSTHSWSWTPQLALECAPHSLRIRSRAENHTSPWERVQRAPDVQRSRRKQVYPRDRVFLAGSRATFCCVLPAGEKFDHMSLSGYEGADMATTKVSDRTYALTLHLNRSSNVCVDVKCKTNTTSYGACAFIGYPPDDKNLQCETRDLESVQCYWAVGRDTHLPLKSPTEYHLIGRLCEEGSKGQCAQKIHLEAGERNWTLRAQNKLGTVELYDRADLTKRVHMFGPIGLRASSVTARKISLTWTWAVERYDRLNQTCQALVRDAGKSTLTETSGIRNNTLDLSGLTPHWSYEVTVRCGTAQHFWKWGDWSESVVLHTLGDVPEALDVWMRTEESKTVVVWKRLLTNQSHGEILDYQVTWRTRAGGAQPQRVTVPRGRRGVTLGLDAGDEHVVAVAARNANGSSSPSTVVVPSRDPGRPAVNPSWITGTNGSFLLSWEAHPAASCGYIVDWNSPDGNDTVEWLRVPPDRTDVSVQSKHFKDGQRYFLSVSACTDGAPVLLQRREGYVRETRIQSGLFEGLNFKQQGSDVEVTWEPIRLRELPAFIHGFTLYCQDQNGESHSVSTNDSMATSLKVTDLETASYTFTVTAVTSVGECGNASFIATVNSQSDRLLLSVFISLGAIFLLLSLATVMCYKHWACIKRKVYPPIPMPVLTEKWSTSEHGNHLVMDPSHYIEADTLDVPELHCNQGVPRNGFVRQEDVWIAFAQASTCHSKRAAPRTDFPPPFLQPAPAASLQRVLPAAAGRFVFPNPSYNMMMQSEVQPYSASPDVPKEAPEAEILDGYQPQSIAQIRNLFQTEEGPPSPMSFSSAYVLLPSST